MNVVDEFVQTIRDLASYEGKCLSWMGKRFVELLHEDRRRLWASMTPLERAKARLVLGPLSRLI
jgi:hypothetical protein